MSVPFLDVGAAQRELRPQLDAAYARVMDSGRYVLGPEVEAFERELAQLNRTAHAVGVGSGLEALEIALRAAGIGPGDEVIVPAHTFIATWLAVARCGAAIVPVDVDERTLLIDPAAVDAAVGERTAAVLPVHLYGRPAAMTALEELAARHGLLLVGDAAQAHGATCDGRPVGALGTVAGFSFYPAKNLGAFGDAGALTTDAPEIAERARRLRNYGSVGKYEHAEIGTNSRLDELQAAFLRVKLTALERWNARRAAIADAYRSALADVEAVTLPPPGGVWHLFCVRHPRRDALRADLAARGVETLIHYPVPPHLSPAFEHLRAGPFPVTEAAATTLLSLPIGPHLDDASVRAVIDAVQASSST